MSIKKLTKIDQKIIPYNGSSIEFAYNWNAISSSGTTGTVTNLTYSSEFWPSYYAYVAVYLTAGITYSTTFGDGMMSDVYLFDSAGNKVASGTMNQETWEYTHMSYTPEADGTFYIRFQQDYFDPNYPEVTVNLSPRPNTPTDRPLYYPWETSEGLNQGKYPIPYSSAREAGVYFDGVPLIGSITASKYLRAWGIFWSNWDPLWWQREIDHSLEYNSLIAAVTDSGERIIYSSSEESKMGISYEDAGFNQVTKVLDLTGYGFQFTNTQTIRSWKIRFQPTSLNTSGDSKLVFRAGDLLDLYLRDTKTEGGEFSRDDSLPEGVAMPEGCFGAIDNLPVRSDDEIWVLPTICGYDSGEKYWPKSMELLYKENDDGSRVYEWSYNLDNRDGWYQYGYFYFSIIPPILMRKYVDREYPRPVTFAMSRTPTGLGDEHRGGTIHFAFKDILGVLTSNRTVDYTNFYEQTIVLNDDVWVSANPQTDNEDKNVYIGGWGGQDWTGQSMRFYMGSLNMSTDAWNQYQIERAVRT